MQEETGQLNRRTFLKFSGAAAAGLAGSRLPHSSGAAGQEASLTSRRIPSNPIVIKSADLEVVFDRQDGLPYEYRVVHGNRRMRGEDLGKAIDVTFCNKATGQFSTLPASVEKATSSKTRTEFTFEIRDGGRQAVGFTLRYVVENAILTIAMPNVDEFPGYELIEVATPRLATVREEDGPAWLAHGDDGGWLVTLSKATTGSLKANQFWGNVAATLPVVMIGTDRVACIQETTAFMDGTELSVIGQAGGRRTSLGTTKTHRVNGSLCYDMNTGPGTPRNCGHRQTPNLLVEQEPACRLDFVSAADDAPPLTWLDGAKLVRQRMPAIPNHLYDDKFVYGIRCDEPSYPQPSSTFEQCEQMIHQIAELTDYSPQIVHLWGWQYRGKDTGYPAVDEVNQRIGGYHGMMRLMEKATDYNCITTLSDNYDDAYRSSPRWDDKIIARRPDGQLWESRNWTGENSYIIGLAKYMAGPGMERVRYTCERYRLPKTTHVDVLSYFSIRNDWDREHPASGIKNLREGRYQVLEEFAKRGVDVSSEALRYAFIGKISSFWYMTGPGTCPFGGTPIPLLAAIYRKSAVWGQSGRTTGPADRSMKTLFYNGCSHAIVRADMNLDDALDTFYLVMVPWFLLHARNIESFHGEGDRAIMGLEGNATIEIDWANKTYSALLNGAPILGETSTFCPLGQDRIALYSLTPKELTAQLPPQWNVNEIRAAKLTVNGPEEFHVAVESNQIRASVEARQPIMIYRNEKARKRSRQIRS
ncbi:MAG TPA: endo-alpha-N-acetylgalactosaminidase family protein [Terriglobales bacterium]|nr:endo-alpha-N-acetylgalactosaminidase family protein [Terriglobales bacterium]